MAPGGWGDGRLRIKDERLREILGKDDDADAGLAGVFRGMMKAVFEQGGAELKVSLLGDERVQSFIDAHAQVLDSSFDEVRMSDRMRQRLQRSDWVFSGMKAFREMGEAFPSLLDANGVRKPFEQFLRDVRKIDETYNKHYLRAEYEFAAASAEMAAKWERFMEDGDRYNLQYRTAGDDRVRPEHAALNGVTLPPSDEFWESYYPPNGWRCRCTVVQVRKKKHPATPHDEAMALGEAALERDTKGMFRFNPGKQERVFPAYNAYTQERCRNCQLGGKETLGKVELAFVPSNELCSVCQIVRQAQASRTQQRLTPSEFNMATQKANDWTENNLTPIVHNGQPTKRTTMRTADGHVIGVGKRFFSETAAKNKRNPELVHILKTATEFSYWLPSATLIRNEAGRHHGYSFNVYTVVYHGRTIEFKCKLTDGELMYTMRFI